MRPRVTLTTDFGTTDGYVGAMKGAMLRRAPDLDLVDITHGIPPGDVDAAAYVTAQATREFPKGTLHLVVVDPGVGTARRAVAVRLEHSAMTWVAPDNGVLSLILPRADDRGRGIGDAVRAVEIVAPAFVPDDASPVFHGRDIFGPAAAFLAIGGALDALGPEIAPDSLLVRDLEIRVESDRAATGRVVYVDHFGNLVTDLALPSPEAAVGCARLAGRDVRLQRTYGDVAHAELVALRGSSGRLEIACNGASAARALGAGVGTVVEFVPT